MILEVQGLFAGKWVKLKYRIGKDIIQNKIDNDEQFGFDSMEDFIRRHTYADSLELLKRYPDNIEMVEGGRLDIIARTSPEVLFDLGDYKLERDNLTLLERLISILKDIDRYPKIEEFSEMFISITNVGEAISILKARD